MTVFWLEKNHYGGRVNYRFESGQLRQHEAHAILSAMKTNDEIRKQFRYCSHSFLGKTDALGLQAADLLAWSCLRSISGHRLHGAAGTMFRPVIRQLVQGPNVLVQHFTGDTLARFIEEQAANAGGLIADVGTHRRTF